MQVSPRFDAGAEDCDHGHEGHATGHNGHAHGGLPRNFGVTCGGLQNPFAPRNDTMGHHGCLVFAGESNQKPGFLRYRIWSIRSISCCHFFRPFARLVATLHGKLRGTPSCLGFPLFWHRSISKHSATWAKTPYPLKLAFICSCLGQGPIFCQWFNYVKSKSSNHHCGHNVACSKHEQRLHGFCPMCAHVFHS